LVLEHNSVNSKLGWILSGPSCEISSGNEIVSNLIVTEGEPELSEVANDQLNIAFGAQRLSALKVK